MANNHRTSHWSRLYQELIDSRDAYESIEVKIMLGAFPAGPEASRRSINETKHMYEILEEMRAIFQDKK